jgi:hypothetical protein
LAYCWRTTVSHRRPAMPLGQLQVPPTQAPLLTQVTLLHASLEHDVYNTAPSELTVTIAVSTMLLIGPIQIRFFETEYDCIPDTIFKS